MSRTYITGSGLTKGFRTGSGFISNPPRVVLRDRDNATGSYPTIARTGDPDFVGQFQSTFDDTKVINFITTNVVYPEVLRPESVWISGGISTPNTLQGIAATGNVVKGVSDRHLAFSSGENLSPFNENRIYIDNKTTFYQTGTNPAILQNFNQKLSSKTIITLDVNPVASTNFFFSTGSSVSGRPVNSGIGYYSWTEKKWHLIGSFLTGSRIDYVNPDPAVRSLTPHAFTSRCEFYPNASPSVVADTAKHIGLPHSTNGFPFASQFDATGSQMLHLSSSLTAPFLVEKISMEFSASFPAFLDAGSPGISSFSEGPNVYQFFLLRVNKQSLNSAVDLQQDLTGSSTGAVTTSRTQTFNLNQYKDLIWTGEIARFDNFTAQTSEWYRDLNLSGTLGVAGISAITGTYRVEAPCRVFGSTTGLLTAPIRPSGSAFPVSTVPLLANKLGRRNFAGISEGRSFIRGTVGTFATGTLYVDDSNTSYKYAIPQIFNIRFDSPYVLMPQDDIVLGFANQSIISGGPTDSVYVSYTEDKIAQQVVTMAPGAGKLTLFGSLLQNNLPIESTTNTPLSSNAIHEDLHYDSPVYDQFDVEPIVALTGSYVDNIITGSMFATPVGDPTASGVRRVIASAVTTPASGSVQRFVNLTSEKDTYYDSFPPDLTEMYKQLGAGLLMYGTTPVMSVSTGSSGLTGVANYWYSQFPYQLSSKRFTNSNLTSGKYSAYDTSNALISNNVSPALLGLYIEGTAGIDLKAYLMSAKGNSFVDAVNNYNNLSNSEKLALLYKYLFGFGDNGIPNATRYSQVAGFTTLYLLSFDSIRGYKYGLAGLSGFFSRNIFRRDRYGQFRDMLEQSPNAAYYVNKSVEYPLTINFVARPDTNGVRKSTNASLTHSQNLDTYATSSLPYFDGTARERNDNPDISLTPVTLG